MLEEENEENEFLIDGFKPLDESYAVDPESLLALFDRLSSVRRAVFTDIFLSRPLRPAEIGSMRMKDFEDLTFEFPQCQYRWRYPDRDVLDIIHLFKA